MILRKAFKAYKIVLYMALSKSSWLATYIKFVLNGVVFKKDFLANGVPLVNVSLKGSFEIGSRFQFNSGEIYNTIGRQQKCCFLVGEHAHLSIGNNVGMSATAIVCKLKIDIEDDVRMGGNVVIYDTDFHSLNVAERTALPEIMDNVGKKPVKISRGAFIGAHTTILKGVTIGENAIIGACSVVTTDIPANEIWAGSPAKFIKTISNSH